MDGGAVGEMTALERSLSFTSVRVKLKTSHQMVTVDAVMPCPSAERHNFMIILHSDPT